jgi:hypothetical protein
MNPASDPEVMKLAGTKVAMSPQRGGSMNIVRGDSRINIGLVSLLEYDSAGKEVDCAAHYISSFEDVKLFLFKKHNNVPCIITGLADLSYDYQVNVFN